MRRLLLAVVLLLQTGLLSADIALPFDIVTTPPNPINVQVSCNRLSGASPLTVFCNASSSTATDVDTPIHNLQYTWSFGDAGSGSWGDQDTGSAGSGANLSRNAAFGPFVAHVFETADGTGTTNFTMTLSVTDGTNTNTTWTQQISVQAGDAAWPTTATICAYNTALGAGCPADADELVTSSWPAVVAAANAGNVRVLLKGGDVFTGAAGNNLSASTGMIGSYGTGKGIIRSTGNGVMLTVGSASSTVSDFRLVDLEFDGQSTTGRAAISASSSYTLSQLTMLRLNIHDIGGGINTAVGAATVVTPTQLALVDSTVQTIISASPGHGWLVGANQLAIMGNLLDNSTAGEHLIRVQYAQGAFINHTTISRSQAASEMVAIRSPEPNQFPATGTNNTQLVVFSDNLVETNTQTAIQPNTAGSLDNSASTLSNIIIERNWFNSVVTGSQRKTCGFIRANQVSYRNNLCQNTNGTVSVMLEVYGQTAGGAAGSTDVWVYNNTGISNATNAFTTVLLGTTLPTNIYIQNNLNYAPNASSSSVAPSTVTVGGTFTHTNNSTGSTGVNLGDQIRLTDPDLVAFPPTTIAEYALQGSSYAIDAGVAVPVFQDFNGAARTGTYDMGAINP